MRSLRNLRALAEIEEAQAFIHDLRYCLDYSRQNFIGRDLSGMSMQAVLKPEAGLAASVAQLIVGCQYYQYFASALAVLLVL
jgi:hypothetical protein